MLARNQLEGIKATINMNSVVKYAHFYLNGEKRGEKNGAGMQGVVFVSVFYGFCVYKDKNFLLLFFLQVFPLNDYLFKRANI